MDNLKDLTDYINKENGKTAYVCGLGPSLKPYLPLLKNNEESFIISCNFVDLMTDLIPKYWCVANSHDASIVAMNERFKKFPDTVIVHGDSMDVTPRSWVINNVKNQYIGFDQRHFNGESCVHCPNKCENLIPERLTIQELLKKISGNEKRFGHGHTIAMFMIALAIILGAKKILIFGVDLDYSHGYVDGVTTNSHSYLPYLDDILYDVKVMNESAKKMGIEIFNMSESSPLSSILPTLKEI